MILRVKGKNIPMCCPAHQCPVRFPTRKLENPPERFTDSKIKILPALEISGLLKRCFRFKLKLTHTHKHRNEMHPEM